MRQGKFEEALNIQRTTYSKCVKIYGEKDLECLKQMISLGYTESRFDLNKGKQILEKFFTLEPEDNLYFLMVSQHFWSNKKF